ncbi:MAG TPA: hypothetical protein DCL38_03135 [Lachnospiraceae bacterium]|nr:hypothetical protein [Lachnospiraceae bacterium]
MDKLKYQLDYLTAINDRLCESDRMYRMIALSDDGLFLYLNLKRDHTELVGPWERYLGYKPLPGEFLVSDLNSFVSEACLDDFIENIVEMDKRGLEHAELMLKSADGKDFRCVGTVYYDENNAPAYRLISFYEADKYREKE